MDDFQKEQHQIARHYDTQLWAIPAVFFALIGLILPEVDKENTRWNVFIFLLASTLSWLLLLLFNKIHCQQLRLSKLIKKSDPSLADFYSPRPGVFNELEKDYRFPKRYLAERRVSWWFKWAMALSALINFGFMIWFLVKILCKI